MSFEEPARVEQRKALLEAIFRVCAHLLESIALRRLTLKVRAFHYGAIRRSRP
jgi:hypothetical protein